MKFMEEHFQIIDMSFFETIIGTSTTMKFDSSLITIYEHVIKMTNIAIRLKFFRMNVDENFFVKLITNLLSLEYSSF
jgi:hypothetical protein